MFASREPDWAGAIQGNRVPALEPPKSDSVSRDPRGGRASLAYPIGLATRWRRPIQLVSAGSRMCLFATLGTDSRGWKLMASTIEIETRRRAHDDALAMILKISGWW